VLILLLEDTCLKVRMIYILLNSVSGSSSFLPVPAYLLESELFGFESDDTEIVSFTTVVLISKS